MTEVLILNPNTTESDKIENSLGEEYHCTFATTTSEAKSLIRSIHFDAIIIDSKVTNNYQALRTDKTRVFITANKSTSDERAYAISKGATDFIDISLKPVEIKAIIQSKIRSQNNESMKLTYKNGPLSADYEKQTLKIEGEQINLTQIEFKILLRLLKSPDKPISREELCKSLNLKGQAKGSRKVDAHISNLRRKLGLYDRILGSVYGQGYVFRENFL